VPGWVMVFAKSFVAANRAADLVKLTWRSGKAATVSERDIQNRAAELIADCNGGSLLVDDPGVEAALASAKQKIERTYTTGTVMHFGLVQRAGFRKRRRFRNSHRESMADVGPSSAGQGAEAQPG
jgi:isoquinoline 1-oxidoreductase beta subunit